MHIILLILKVLGIVLLAILGLLLLVLLLVLFMPIRYRFAMEKYEEFKGNLKFHWLFPILYGKVDYEKELTYEVKVLWFPIYPPKEKKEKSRKKTKTTGKKKKEKPGKAEEGTLTAMEIPSKRDTSEKTQSSERISPKEISFRKSNNKTGDLEIKKSEIELDHVNFINIPREKTSKIRTFFQKIKVIIQKIKAFFINRKAWLIDFKSKIIELLQTLKEINRKRELIFNFLGDENNKKGIGRIWHSIKKVLKHLIPKKLKGEVHFGLDDPASTGQALGVIAMFYGIYGNQFKIIPNFEESVMEGDLFVKGRIRLFTLGVICIKLLLDDDFKKLKYNFERIQEEM